MKTQNNQLRIQNTPIPGGYVLRTHIPSQTITVSSTPEQTSAVFTGMINMNTEKALTPAGWKVSRWHWRGISLNISNRMCTRRIIRNICLYYERYQRAGMENFLFQRIMERHLSKDTCDCPWHLCGRGTGYRLAADKRMRIDTLFCKSVRWSVKTTDDRGDWKRLTLENYMTCVWVSDDAKTIVAGTAGYTTREMITAWSQPVCSMDAGRSFWRLMQQCFSQWQ